MILRILSILVLAAAPAAAVRYQVRVYGTERGLPSSAMISSLLQDRHGFVWAGGAAGLFRWNGDRFEPYGPDQGLSSANVLALHESRDGVLWVATSQGLARLGSQGFEPVELRGWAQTAVTSVVSDSRGRLFAGTPRGLLVGVPSEGKFSFSLQARAGDSAPATGLHIDTAQRLWYWCGARICQFTNAGILEFPVPANAGDPVRGFTVSAPDGSVWATGGRGLIVLDKGAAEFRQASLLTPNADVRSLTLDRDGHLLAGTQAGVVKWSGETAELIGRAQGLPDDWITAMLHDSTGSLWAASGGAGLIRLPGYERWQGWSAPDGLPGPVLAAARDTAGTVWAGSNTGLWRLVRGKWLPWSIPGRARVRVDSLAASADGVVWAASSEGMLARIQPAVGRTLLCGAREGLAGNQVRQLGLSREGALWVLAREGLYRLRPGIPVAFEQIAAPAARRMAFAPDGRLWLAAETLYVMDQSGAVTKNAVTGLPASLDMLAASGDSLWLASAAENGAWRLDLKTGRLDARTLASRTVRFLAADAKGRIWAGSGNGVNLREGARWRHFGEAEGLLNSDCSPHAFADGGDGSVLIGGAAGVSEYRIPPVEIGGSPSVVLSSLVVSPEEKTLRATLAAPTALDDSALRFRYRLAGLEEQWTETRSREIRYSRLPGGSYTLEVQASAAEESWTDQTLQHKFSLPLPWWGTAQFRGGALASLVVLFILAVKRRREAAKMRRVKEEESARVTEEQLAKARREIDSAQALAAARDAEARQLRDEIEKLRKPVGAAVPFRLRELLHGILIGVSSRGAHKGVAVSSRISAEVPDAVEAASTTLKQVLTDLTLEAIDRTSEGEVVVHARLEGAELRFTIKHGGDAGLPAPLQGSAAQDGIGLASERGAFHCFVKASPAAGAPRGLRVLVAEDNEINQQLIRKLLEKKGHTVTGAGTGTQALAELERKEFDLALFDVQMPEMGGFEATGRVREQEKMTGRHLRILGLSSSPLAIERDRCLAAGMDGYIRKPILAADFYSAIEGPRAQPARQG